MATNNDSQAWTGWVAFASFMMILVGFFQAFVGLTAILKDQFFVITPNYLITVSTKQWGWTHLVLSLVVLFAGFALLQGKVWARTVGVLLALLSAAVNLAFIPYYPLWSILIVVLNVVVIYALIVHGGELAE